MIFGTEAHNRGEGRWRKFDKLSLKDVQTPVHIVVMFALNFRAANRLTEPSLIMQVLTELCIGLFNDMQTNVLEYRLGLQRSIGVMDYVDDMYFYVIDVLTMR